MKTKIILVSAVVVAGSLAYISLTGNQQSVTSAEMAAHSKALPQTQQNADQTRMVGLPKALQKPELLPADQLIEQLSIKMREQFGDTIDNVVVQVSLKDLRLGLESDYPGQGYEMFELILRKAFPELADEILLALANMDRYDEWLVDSYLDLNDMDAISKDNTIWNKRIELFGEEDARRIWNEEIAQDVQRERNVKTVMNELNTAYDMPLEDRIYTMQVAMQENYGATAEGMVLGTGNIITQLVFRLDSVQKELAAMEYEARQETINQMRLQLGFPEDRIAVLAEQDKKNNEMWEKGYSYMAERKMLVASYQGDDLETELDLLRLKHFDDRHAYSIKQEESLGMMRYERPRVYGLN